MKKKKCITAIVLLFLFVLSGLVWADSQGITVYVTKTGKKYHVESCRYLRSSKIPITLESAKSQGYDPCSVCSPSR